MILNHKVEAFVCSVSSGSAHFTVIHSFNFLLERLEAVMPSAARRGLLSSSLLGAMESREETGGEKRPHVASKQVAYCRDCLNWAREGSCSQAFAVVGACFSSNHYTKYDDTLLTARGYCDQVPKA